MGNSRAEWAKTLRSRNQKLVDGYEIFASTKKRVTKSKVTIKHKRIIAMPLIKTQFGDEYHYTNENGAYMIVAPHYTVIKMPYSLSVNAIWRATLDQNGRQRNSLSISAKNYKRNVIEMYKPILDELQFIKINQISEVRLIAQPPVQSKKFSAMTYPRYDIDNYPKLIIDTLKDLFIKDDNIFIRENIQLAKPIENGCVWVSIIPVQQENWLQQSVDFDWLKGA